jgi:hypothetical protein
MTALALSSIWRKDRRCLPEAGYDSISLVLHLEEGQEVLASTTSSLRIVAADTSFNIFKKG